MGTRFSHTNIVCADWRRLAHFYQAVFDCTFVPPERDQSGQWLEDGTGVKGARLRGVHLRLPGFGDAGPTLELFSYSQMEEKGEAVANRKGLGHIAFAVDDVESTIKKVLANDGSMLGKVVSREIPGAGRITFAYVTDPEGNIIEVQRWEK